MGGLLATGSGGDSCAQLVDGAVQGRIDGLLPGSCIVAIAVIGKQHAAR